MHNFFKSIGTYISFLMLIVPSFPLSSQEIQPLEVSCIHRQVCNMLYDLKKDLQIKKLIILPITFKSNDPHHENLTFMTIKKIMNAKYLILPPKNLVPNLSKIKLNHLHYTLKPAKNFEHFWLNQIEICKLKDDLINKFKAWKFLKYNIKYSIQNCLKKERHLQSNRSFLDKEKFKLIVLSHHGLEHFFKNKNISVLTLSNEHGNIHLNSSQMKEILNHFKQKSILFIEEEQIPLPNFPFKNSLNKKNYIKINTLGKLAAPSNQVLQLLKEKIGNL